MNSVITTKTLHIIWHTAAKSIQNIEQGDTETLFRKQWFLHQIGLYSLLTCPRFVSKTRTVLNWLWAILDEKESWSSFHMGKWRYKRNPKVLERLSITWIPLTRRWWSRATQSKDLGMKYPRFVHLSFITWVALRKLVLSTDSEAVKWKH